MKRAVLMLQLGAAQLVAYAWSAEAQWKYLAPPTTSAADVWFCKRYEDPYRKLEDTGNKAIGAWFKAQAVLADGVMTQVPGHDALVKEWLAMDRRAPPTYRDVQIEGRRALFRKTVGGENVRKLYVREGWDGPDEPPSRTTGRRRLLIPHALNARRAGAATA
jgi:hypothetical protein